MRSVTRRVDISGRTIAKVLFAAALVWLWLRLWQWVLLVVVAAFIAIGLDPLVLWLEERHVRRAWGAPLIMLALVILIGGFTWLAGAELVDQSGLLARRFREVQSQIGPQLPGWVAQVPLPEPRRFADSTAKLAAALASGVISVGVAFILALYLLMDGRRTFEWLAAFAPRRHRPRVQRTALEARRVIGAYVIGNVITSTLAAATAYVFLLILKVPAALLLALLTGLFDFVPVIGIFLSAVPMVLLALTVSPTAAILTVLFNIVYNIVENYYISPKVYGRDLPLSSLAIILAFAVGAELGGVVGALVALPLAAIYPSLERIWLAARVGPHAADAHRRIEQSEEH